MERRDCDAVVLFGASGDLCYSQDSIRRSISLSAAALLSVPVIGVARQGWQAAQLARRACARA